MNPNYIDQYFKKYMNVSIHTYVIEKRIELAKEVLREGSTVTDACNKSGFGNYSNFIRTFGTKVGVSPGKYKKKYASTV
ncbi:AraC family transcriptional regulator [Lentilactobacillus sp. Marseille-Q4993]|uniref:helix-turn-helix domain-containing protein n=1 Tax=Lentilactobacillus sp. Marseille-Q4993 TaxID=3039492 RepID=UPI0024BD01A3|nr:AraC family transcriptional regulator [Lentilactobacillus sp. Marseille-Q4993]